MIIIIQALQGHSQGGWQGVYIPNEPSDEKTTPIVLRTDVEKMFIKVDVHPATAWPFDLPGYASDFCTCNGSNRTRTGPSV